MEITLSDAVLVEQWQWLKSVKQFFHSILGRLLSIPALRTAAELNLGIHINKAHTLSELLFSDVITIGEWQAGMRDLLKEIYVQQYLLGIGGLHNMDFKHYGSIGGMLTEQYKWLDNFAVEIASGELTPGQILMRIDMYVNSSRESFWRAFSRMHGIPKLPAYPGDGSTVCLTNCRCEWDIEDLLDDQENPGWNCTWLLGAAEHCDDCIERSTTWNPLFVPMPAAGE